MRVDAAEFIPAAYAANAEGFSIQAAEFVPTSIDEQKTGESEWPSLGAARQRPRRGRLASSGGSNGSNAAASTTSDCKGSVGEASTATAATATAGAADMPQNVEENRHANTAVFGGCQTLGETGAGAVDSSYHTMGEVSQYYYNGHDCAMGFRDEETFLTPALMRSGAALASEMMLPKSTVEGDMPVQPLDPEIACLQVKGRRLLWDVRGTVVEGEGIPVGNLALSGMACGECLESPIFWVAGVYLRLAFYPSGTAHTEEGDCAVALLSEEKAKLKFELFLDSRSSGRKVMLGKRFACDFRQPAGLAADDGAVTVGVEVHANLLYAGLFF